MSEMSMNRPGKGQEEVQGYPNRDEDFDPAAESYRLPEEAVFLGTEGERPWPIPPPSTPTTATSA